MKRDLELVRKILFAMEDHKDVTFVDYDNVLKFDHYSEEQVLYHMKIMAQAGFLHEDLDSGRSKYYSISWNGHEFIGALRDEGQWIKIKSIMTRAGGFITDVALDVAKEIIKQAAFKLITPQ